MISILPTHPHLLWTLWLVLDQSKGLVSAEATSIGDRVSQPVPQLYLRFKTVFPQIHISFPSLHSDLVFHCNPPVFSGPPPCHSFFLLPHVCLIVPFLSTWPAQLQDFTLLLTLSTVPGSFSRLQSYLEALCSPATSGGTTSLQRLQWFRLRVTFSTLARAISQKYPILPPNHVAWEHSISSKLLSLKTFFKFKEFNHPIYLMCSPGFSEDLPKP